MIPSIIRASVDALCRDGTGQISSDPRKNCLKTRRECLTRPSKLTKTHSRASIQLSTCRKASYMAPILCARICSHAISRILVIIIIFFLFFSKPAISMLERVDRLILLRSVSRVGGSVHGHKAIVSFLFLVSTVRSWSSPRKTVNDAIFCQLNMRGKCTCQIGASRMQVAVRWLLCTYRAKNA